MSRVPQATTTVYVTVLDENDNAPTFQQQLYEVTLDEGPSTLNATLVTVQALDEDEGPNGTVTYAISEGNILGTFHINSSTVSTGTGAGPGTAPALCPRCQRSPVLAGPDPHGQGAGLRDQPRALHPARHCHRPVPHRVAAPDVQCHRKELLARGVGTLWPVWSQRVPTPGAVSHLFPGAQSLLFPALATLPSC